MVPFWQLCRCGLALVLALSRWHRQQRPGRHLQLDVRSLRPWYFFFHWGLSLLFVPRGCLWQCLGARLCGLLRALHCSAGLFLPPGLYDEFCHNLPYRRLLPRRLFAQRALLLLRRVHSCGAGGAAALHLERKHARWQRRGRVDRRAGHCCGLFSAAWRGAGLYAECLCCRMGGQPRARRVAHWVRLDPRGLGRQCLRRRAWQRGGLWAPARHRA